MGEHKHAFHEAYDAHDAAAAARSLAPKEGPSGPDPANSAIVGTQRRCWACVTVSELGERAICKEIAWSEMVRCILLCSAIQQRNRLLSY